MTSVPISITNDSIATRPDLPAQLLNRNHSIKMKPILQTINRKPHVWQNRSSSSSSSPTTYTTEEGCHDDMTNPCHIVPSGILFQEREDDSPFDLAQVTLESYRVRECKENTDDSTSSPPLFSNDGDCYDDRLGQESENKGSKLSVVTYRHKHVLRYKGEMVCVFQTCHFVNAHGTWGQSMTIRRCGADGRGQLQAHIVHKGRTATGNGWNAHERRTYRIMDILEAAAERCSRQHSTTTTTPCDKSYSKQ